MPQVIVRNLKTETVEKLRSRAKRNGRSLESEVRLILDQASGENIVSNLEIIERVRSRFSGKTFIDSVELIREDRER